MSPRRFNRKMDLNKLMHHKKRNTFNKSGEFVFISEEKLLKTCRSSDNLHPTTSKEERLRKNLIAK